MQNTKFGRITNLSTDWFYVFLIVIIVVGILLRCIHVDSRVYWGDEIVTSLRIAGYGYPEVIQELINKPTVSIADLMLYQHPSSVRGLTATVQELITEEPQHTPIYFLLAHLWTHWFKDFGSAVVVVRSFSVFASLLSLPCLYWLCIELFGSRYVGLIATAMVSVSPFHLVYAQEARPPALWFLAITLSSALLLRALRLNTNLSWIVYAISVVFNLYTFLFSVFVLASHGIYILFMQGFRLTKGMIAYLIAMVVGLLAFLPWFLVIISKLSVVNNATGWSSEKIGSLNLLRMMLNNFRDVFFDVGGGYAYLTFLLLTLTAFSLYFLAKTTPTSVWVFVFCLIGVTALVLLLPDFIMGGKARSAASRYFIAPYLGIHLSLAYLFSTQVSAVRGWFRNFWQAITALLLVLGTASCIAISQSEVSFNQATYRNSPMLARTINKYERPLVFISTKYSNNIIGAIGLSYWLRPDTQFQFVPDTHPIQFSERAKAVFVYGGDSKLILNSANTKYQAKLVFDDLKNQCCSENLWYLEGRQRN
jgi:uncharacterized membrane protein